MDDFIGVYDNQVPNDLCDQIVKYFDDSQSHGFTTNRQAHENAKKSEKEDSFAYAPPITEFPSSCLKTDHWVYLNKLIWNAYEKYADKYAVALTENTAEHGIYSFKIQKTKPSQGYHRWHYELGAREATGRILFFILYLNDVDEGGETEFLYYHKRVKPKKGTLLIAPAHFTHTHRGNPPLSGDKYIITGWVEF